MNAILIIDDERDEVGPFGDVLASHFQQEGYDVLTFADPKEVFTELDGRKLEPEVFLVDFDLGPHGTAEDVLLLIRRDYPHAKIMLLTGRATLEDISLCSQRNLFDDVLSKSAPVEAVAEKVSQLLTTKRADLVQVIEEVVQQSPNRDQPRFVRVATHDAQHMSDVDVLNEIRAGTKLGRRILDAAVWLVKSTLLPEGRDGKSTR